MILVAPLTDFSKELAILTLSGLVGDGGRSQGGQCAIREDVVQRQVVKKARRLVGCEIVGRWSRLG